MIKHNLTAVNEQNAYVADNNTTTSDCQQLKETKRTLQDQINLEKDMRDGGIERYRRQVDSAKEKGCEAVLKPQQELMAQFIIPVAAGIKEYVESIKKSNCGKRAKTVYPYLDAMLSQKIKYETMALYSLKALFNRISQKEIKLAHCAFEVGSILNDEYNVTKFREANKGLDFKIRSDLKDRNITSPRFHAITVNKTAKWSKGQTELETWSKAHLVQIGGMMIDTICQKTGVISTKIRRERRKTISEIEISTALISWLNKTHAKCELFSPLKMPLLIQPKPWTSFSEGGYHSGLIRNNLVRRMQNVAGIYDRANIPEVYAAINNVQDTAWHVNSFVLDIMNTAFDEDRNLFDLPVNIEEIEIPRFEGDWDALSNENKRKHAQQRVIAYDKRKVMTSKAIKLKSIVNTANKFKDEQEFFFAWNLDSRGRCYPIADSLSPQGDDTSKALLLFAEGKELGSEEAICHHLVHGANLFGYDKCSLQERVDWAKDNYVEIRKSGQDPYSSNFWLEADKPWQFIAWCREYYLMSDVSEKDGEDTLIFYEDFVSHLPIAMDGSCNGIQHFSAMLRDERGGKAVNLLPSDKPNDIYMEVCNEVIRRVNSSTEDLAYKWRGDLIDRGLCKPPTMTKPYGVTGFGVVEQVISHYHKQLEKGKVYNFDGNGRAECKFIAGHIEKALGTVVSSADDVMKYLQDVSKVTVEQGEQVCWTVPTGFPVLQSYKKQQTKDINTCLAGKRFRIKLSEDLDEIDKRKNITGVAPNFVHSFDAAHMMKTVNACVRSKISSFMLVHDSYATHACDYAEMARICRDEFVTLYKDKNVLEQFKQEQINPDWSEETLQEIEGIKVPQFGNLDLDQVKQSDYFFA